MTYLASELPLPDLDQARLEQEFHEIESIYRRLFDDRDINLVLQEGENPRAGDAHIVEGDVTFRPQSLTASLIGRVTLPAEHPTANPVTAFITIPSLPTEGEWKNDGAPWQPPRKLKPIFNASPLIYEKIRYGYEVNRMKKAAKRHNWNALPFSRGKITIDQPPAADKRPAILIGFHWLEIGGAEKLAFDTVAWALEAGLRVFVVASIPSIHRLADRLPDHPDVTFLRLDRYLPHGYWPKFIEKLVLAENIRLIHVHHCTPLYDSLAHLAVTTPEVKVIDSTHIIENSDGGYPRVSGVWTNYIDLHHVISRQLVDFYDQNYHMGHKARLGRMLTRNAEPTPLSPIHTKAGQKTLNIAFIGRYQYQKRPVILILILRALAKWAKQNGVTLKARLVGDGAMRPVTEDLVRRFGLTEIVEFMPGVSDVPALLEDSDILLLPSNNEGLALVCYEAIMHGCIPITTDVGAQKEIVPEALLVKTEPSATVRETVKAIDRLWRDQSLIDAQAQALTRLYRQLEADPTAKEVLMPIYRAAAEGKSLPL